MSEIIGVFLYPLVAIHCSHSDKRARETESARRERESARVGQRETERGRERKRERAREGKEREG